MVKHITTALIRIFYVTSFLVLLVALFATTSRFTSISPTYQQVIITNRTPISKDSVRLDEKIFTFSSINDSLLSETKGKQVVLADTTVINTVEEEDDDNFFPDNPAGDILNNY